VDRDEVSRPESAILVVAGDVHNLPAIKLLLSPAYPVQPRMRVASQDNDISPISRGPIGRKLLVQITEDMQTHILLDDFGGAG